MLFCNVSRWAQLVSFLWEDVKLSRIVIYRSKIIRVKCSLNWSCINYGELHCGLVARSSLPKDNMSLLTWARISFLGNTRHSKSGVSIKLEVASGLDRVTDFINKGPLVPFSRAGRDGTSKRVLPQKVLKFQSPKNVIFSVLGTKFEDKRACFSFKKM